MNHGFIKSALVEKMAESAARKFLLPPKKRILLLGDDAAMRRILLHLLAGENYSVSCAMDGVEALEFASVAKFDLMLLDLNLSDENGRRAFTLITSENPRVPVIVISARPDRFFLSLVSDFGVLLEKPLDFVLLFRTIRDLLEESLERQLKGLSRRSSNATRVAAE